MKVLINDVRDAVRGLRRRPRSVILPVAILAVSIALAVSVFAVLQGVLLRGLPMRGGDRFVIVATGQRASDGTSLSDVAALREAVEARDSAFEGLVTSMALNSFLTGEGRGTIGTTATYASSDLFELLEIDAALGRTFVSTDEDAESPVVSVIGHSLWQSYFGGDESVLGQQLVINRQSTTIVGVMPPGFAFPYRQDLWVVHRPESMAFRSDSSAVMARLAPGASVEQARAEVGLLARRMDLSDPLEEPRGAWVIPFMEEVVDESTRRALHLLMASVLGVLAIACANAANMRLANVLSRRAELSTRLALGAGRGRLVSLLTAEAAVIAVVGSVCGLGLAWLLTREVGQALVQGSLLRGYWMDVRIDSAVIATTGLIALAVVVLVGLVPALVVGHLADLRAGMQARRIAPRGLVALQVGLSFALVASAGTLGRNALALLDAQLGFDPRGLLTARLSLFQNGEMERDGHQVFYEELVRRLESRPEIERAAVGATVPWGWSASTEVRLESSLERVWPPTRVYGVTPGYLETVGLSLLAGRYPTAADVIGDQLPLVVTPSFVERRFADIDEAIGSSLVIEDDDSKTAVIVIGVVADFGMSQLQRDPAADDQVYLGRRVDWNGSSLLLRSRVDESEARAALEAELEALDPLAAAYNHSSFDADRSTSTWEQRRLAQLLVVFGLAGLLLTAGGLYSTIDVAGRGRAREFAVRLALGAVPAQVRGLVVREGVLLLLVGFGIGLATLAFLAPRLGQFLVRGSVWDPPVVAVAAALLGSIVALAVAGPARRAARVDPASTLRSE